MLCITKRVFFSGDESKWSDGLSARRHDEVTTDPPEHASGNAPGQAGQTIVQIIFCTIGSASISPRWFGPGVHAAGDGIPSQNGVRRRCSRVVSGRMGRT